MNKLLAFIQEIVPSLQKVKGGFYEILKVIFNSQAFLGLIQDGLLKLLKSQAMGGFRGWVIRLVVKNFSKEVVEIASDYTEYTITKKEIEDTVNETDRDRATDILNSSMR